MEYEPPVPTPYELHAEAKAMQERLDDERRAEAMYQETEAMRDRAHLLAEDDFFKGNTAVYGPRLMLSLLRRLDALEAQQSPSVKEKNAMLRDTQARLHRPGRMF